MITNADIIKLAKVLATKEDINRLDLRLDKVENTLDAHTIAIDGLVRDVAEIKLENRVIKPHLKLI